jgi:cycloeucalenol cycloisomerase
VFAADPDKSWTERFVLYYSAFWISVVIVVMATQAFARWGDVGHMLLGVGLASPMWIVPLIWKRGGAHIWRYNLWIGLYSLLQVYFGSGLFFDVLHMEYKFPVTWILNRTPLFLYPMTIAYFSTYYVIMSLAWRQARKLPSLPRFLALCAIGYAVAFGETAGMANEWLRGYFNYGDKWFVLSRGSACYGSIFVLSLPFVFRLDEDERPSWSRIVMEVLAVQMAALIVYEGWTWLLK